MICFSCTNEPNKLHQDEHQEHGTEDVVYLNKQQRDALDIRLGEFQMRNLTTVIKTNGQLEVPPASRAEVTAIVGGNVKEIRVFHGDKVRRGQELAILEHPDYISIQEDFAEAIHKLAYLEKEYLRQKELFESNVGAGREYQLAESEYLSARSRYEGLKSRLELLNLSPDRVSEGIISNTIALKAPISGYVSAIDITLGSYADARTRLFWISDNSQIHADFMVYEADVHLLRPGQKIHFTVSNRPEEEFPATIFAIGREFETNTRSVHIHAALDKKTDGLIPGMYISGHIHTDEKYTRTLPDEAIVTEGTKSYIFILDDKENDQSMEQEDTETDLDKNDIKAFRRVEVITGLKDDGFTGINLIEPIPADTRIVLSPAYYLLSDMKKGETGHAH
jgi:cobalt-zinc-cadmium efflux system membrane fusion protein